MDVIFYIENDNFRIPDLPFLTQSLGPQLARSRSIDLVTRSFRLAKKVVIFLISVCALFRDRSRASLMTT